MNVKEFIESGTLELYALGELSEKEAKEVESLMMKYPEIREELDQIELAMESLYSQVKVEPRKELKDDLLQKVSENSAPSGRAPRINWIVAASITLTFISSITTINFYSKWKSTSGQLISLQNEKLQLAEDLDQANYKYSELDNALAIVTSDSFQKITLEGTQNAPLSKAVIYWNVDSNELYFNDVDMQELTPDQQFQLWAIVDGKPIDIGMIAKETDTDLQKMKGFTGTPSAFAITVEPTGGSESPSLENMQVLGNVVS